MNVIDLLLELIFFWIRFVLKKRNRIGESGDFCGRFVWGKLYGFEVWLFIIIVVVWWE